MKRLCGPSVLLVPVPVPMPMPEKIFGPTLEANGRELGQALDDDLVVPKKVGQGHGQGHGHD